MRIVFSRKGFDSSYGGAPSPIVDGVPISLPIPGGNGEQTTFAERGLGDTVMQVTRGKIAPDAACHDDPMFAEGHCWLGQVGAAQGHLEKQGVREGDHFLFFGLFADPETGERHHRIFGHMRVVAKGPPQGIASHPRWKEPPRPHPHFAGEWHSSNCIWFGSGATAQRASSALRLTCEEGPLCRWQVPRWLKPRGLSYHGNPARWRSGGRLEAVSRGQEFVTDIGKAREPREWLERVIAEIES